MDHHRYPSPTWMRDTSRYRLEQNPAPSYRPTPRVAEPPISTQRPIIEISDDESDYQPLPHRLANSHRSRQRSSSSEDSDSHHSDTDANEGAVRYRRSRSPQIYKRIRTAADALSTSNRAPSRPHGRRSQSPASPQLTAAAPAGSRFHSTLQFHSRPLNEKSATPDQFARQIGSHSNRQLKTKPKKEKTAKQPPYYLDGRLDVKMYRGPGFERFPVVLGTIEGHQELCDKWDREESASLERKAAKLKRAITTPFMIHSSESDSSDDLEEDAKAAFEKECLNSVIDVFPDIEHAFVLEKIRSQPPQPQYLDEDDEITILGAPPQAEQLIAQILEMESYPKERVANSLANGKAAAADGTGITINWNRDLPKDDMYRKDAVILLAKTFIHVPTHFISRVVGEKKSIFDAYVHIQTLEDQFYSLSTRPYGRLRNPRVEVEKKYMLAYNDRRIPAEYANRINELQAAKQHVARQAIEVAAQKAKEEAETLNLAQHKETGAIMECQCCFDAEVPLNRVVPCVAETPHFFCFTCVEGLADNQIGLMKYEMMCMDGSGCTCELSYEGIGKAVPIKTFDRLELNKQQAEIMAANIEGLEQCPFCDYKAVCEGVDEEPVFYCQNPDCSRATCRKCHKDNHLPKTCEENDRDKNLSARHVVEEARSEAVMRTCPKCRVKIIKDFGCNKMICSGCGCILCYECKADLSVLGGNAYHHFNKQGAKCSLYDREGVNRHEQEANKAETDAINKAKAQDADLDEGKLRVDTNMVKRSTLADHPAADVFYRDMNNRAGRLNNRQRHLQDMRAHVERLEELRPDPALDALLGQVHQFNAEMRQNRVLNLQERAQQMLRLNELHLQAAANLAQHEVPVHPPPLLAHDRAALYAQPFENFGSLDGGLRFNEHGFRVDFRVQLNNAPAQNNQIPPPARMPQLPDPAHDFGVHNTFPVPQLAANNFVGAQRAHRR